MMNPGSGGGGGITYVTGWQYWGTLKYSKKFLAVTRSAVIAGVTQFIPFASIRAISVIANTFLAAYAPNEYVTEKIYRIWLVNRINGGRIVLKERTDYYFYSNSARTHFIGKISRTYNK